MGKFGMPCALGKTKREVTLPQCDNHEAPFDVHA